ncbi:Thiosulfate sulfurtransferase/rhodanese-like domain-containing protein 3 [Armadillidium vulgare]|nr:Thiosulfate sulfurtransferase/rhodanese-like domain-containing protein 3 [Armadillidium vulgare]
MNCERYLREPYDIKALGITFFELIDGLNNGEIFLLDVRTREELLFDGAIPNSFNVPIKEVKYVFSQTDEEFQSFYGFRKPNADKLVISCRGGTRALRAWRILNQFGFCGSRVYYGSFKDWVKNNGPILKL